MFETAEKRVNKCGNITYWENGVIIGRKCTKCGKDKFIDEFRFDKRKNLYRGNCKECDAEATRKREVNPDKKREWNEKYRKNNFDKIKEWSKKYYKNNFDKIKEYQKEYRKSNTDKKREWDKKYREKHKEYLREKDKKYREVNKKKNLKEIADLLEQINPILKDLPVYGYIYKFKNVKTGRCYIGQTILPLNKRYGCEGGIIKSWIKERLDKKNQKFKEELIEEDIEVTEMLGVGCCEYHLNALEFYYIDKYNSYREGYNNTAGNYKTNDGLEEFNQILKENNLEFINGKLMKIV